MESSRHFDLCCLVGEVGNTPPTLAAPIVRRQQCVGPAPLSLATFLSVFDELLANNTPKGIREAIIVRIHALPQRIVDQGLGRTSLRNSSAPLALVSPGLAWSTVELRGEAVSHLSSRRPGRARGRVLGVGRRRSGTELLVHLVDDPVLLHKVGRLDKEGDQAGSNGQITQRTVHPARQSSSVGGAAHDERRHQNQHRPSGPGENLTTEAPDLFQMFCTDAGFFDRPTNGAGDADEVEKRHGVCEHRE